MKRALYYLLVAFYSHIALGQDTLVVRQDTFPSSIQTEYLTNSVKFTPVIRPLVPIPGGRQAYYTYLWDFGDGQFSTQESPEHQYEEPGEYDVSLYIVNNYDNGPRPKKPKTKVKVESKLAGTDKLPNIFERNFFKSNEVFQLFKNANAVPGEDMSLIVGVKPSAAKGKILLLTNEKLINPNGFIVADQSRYHNENILPMERKKELESLWANVTHTSITQSGSPDYGIREELDFRGDEAARFFNNLLDEYNTVTQYEIEGDVGDSQFSIINLDITPEMLADTNAIVTVTGIYLAEGGNPVIHKLDVPIIKSHDPNKMSVRPALMDYRLQFKKKTLTYKVQFQNDGEGDAKNIRLEMFFPNQVDVNTFRLLNLYPQCDTCLTNQDLGCYTYQIKDDDKIIFHFRGIALPGTASPTITDQDSTKGFIRFTLKSHKKLQNKSLPSYTNIYFDKNDPIRTNTSTARFRPGLSPIITLGLNAPAKHPNDEIGKLTKGLTIGVGLAPIAPYKKPYWQVELYASTFGVDYATSFFDRKGEIQLPNERGDLMYYGYSGLDSLATKKYLSLQVPVQIRYNISRYISAGIGALVKTNINLQNDQQATYHLINAGGERTEHTVNRNVEKEKISPLLLAPLMDLNIGRAYLGPAFGIRYHFDKTYKSNLNFYLMWRL
ncbi:PKD domain-containing protein [Sphingobacterium corticibacterium]|uniref:PKD domain-containing protein n=1 Tax=Sphingobacterium corticibacterium TaxID=2484746 RepID=A0A4Q6Y165_9SPHI|nr:PKD domain-containing protein [Sphingobacterium corticibacterium]RZF62736.1 PKD domain-containing protein [Sphingobacterium corticibacterium]